MKRITLLFLTLFTLSCSVIFAQDTFQETVYLKDGSIIKGIIVEQVPNQSIKIQTADGSLFVFEMDEVEKITKESVSNKTVSSFSTKSYKQTGYRGFIDFGYTFGTGDFDLGRLELTTSHGALITPNLFIGGGTGIHYYCTDGLSEVVVPLFLDIQGIANSTKSIAPFGGLKIGYSFDATESFEDLGLYFAPSVGMKFLLDNNKSINLSLGYTFQYVKVYIYYYGYGGYIQTKHVNMGGISLKVGFEF